MNNIFCFSRVFFIGWGLRTLTPITQGSFILSYIGELITDEEAERREDTYLFNLDLKVSNILVSILFIIFFYLRDKVYVGIKK